MKKLFYFVMTGLSFEVNASEMKDVLRETNSEQKEKLPMSEITTLQSEELEQSQVDGTDATMDSAAKTDYVMVEKTVPYQAWIPSGYMRHNGTWPFGSDEWIDTSHYETRYRVKFIKMPSKVQNSENYLSTTDK